MTNVNLSGGLEYVISLTLTPSSSPLKTPAAGGNESVVPLLKDVEEKTLLLYFRVYAIRLKKSGQKLPRVELEEMGPAINWTLKRTKFAPDDVWRQATRVPKPLRVISPLLSNTFNQVKKVKNVEKNEMGDEIGRVHMQKQDLTELQTRKMKALKLQKQSSASLEEEEEEEEEEADEMIID